MDQDKLRIEYLEGKEGLSHEEMQELIKLKPPGTFLRLPDASTLGIKDLDRQIQNLKERPGRIFHALRNGCYIEAIALRAQYLEIWLRMYWVVKNKRRRVFAPGDKRTFGQVITDCEICCFRIDLIQDLRQFNQERINAVHKYFLGDTDYDTLEQICNQTSSLDRQVRDYVLSEIGIVID